MLSKHLIDDCFCRSIDVFLTETGAVLDVQENRGEKSVLLRSYVAHSAHWRRVRIRGRFSPSCLTILQTHKWLKLTCTQFFKFLLLIQVFKIHPMWPVGHCSSFVAKRKICTIRVAQNAPKVKKLQGHQSQSCFLPNCWEKCIETPKKLIARGGNRLRRLEPHLPYGYQGKNATFWSSSF